MFEFLKKPPLQSISDFDTRDIPIESREESVPSDVGQIAVDILETHEGYLIVAPLAGVPRNDVDVTVSHNVLTITGNRPEPEIYKEAFKIPIKECFYGPFSRSIILPENLVMDAIRATIERGMLMVTIPFYAVNSHSVKVENMEDIDA